MGEVVPALGETPADEQAAMAGQWLVLGAHQRRPGARSHCLDLGEALGEQWACRHPLVIGDAAARTAAEFEAQEHVADAGGVEALFQLSAVEVRQPRNGV